MTTTAVAPPATRRASRAGVARERAAKRRRLAGGDAVSRFGPVTRLPAAHASASLRRRLASQVVAWHNGHALARRIRRRDLGGCGVIALPFSAPPPDSDPAGLAGRLPLFDELPIAPPLSRDKVVALALSRGWLQRPDGGEWPLRRVAVGTGWREDDAQPVYLLTVALRRGRGRPPARLLAGREVTAPAHDPASVVGHRQLSRPRLALGAGLVSVPALLVAGWIAWAAWPAGRLPAEAAAVAPRPAERAAAPPGPLRPGVAPPTGPSAGPAGTAPDLPATATATVDAPLPAPAGRRAAAAPKVGAGVPADVGDTRGAVPSRFRLVGPAQSDPAVLRSQAQQLESTLRSMGQTGSRLRVDVVGTHEGDALSVGPLADQAEAEQVARRLAARGIAWQIVEQ
ncbi:hypothetical protein [Ideonella sp.]|uniref:hypothetical protein n=1 Tax=Ideonella sp. TaxID=1929293 RepID=UPI0035B27E20